MRVAAIVYILLSLLANFWYGNLTTFVLAAFSFPLLVWLLVRKRKTATPKPHNKEFTDRAAS